MFFSASGIADVIAHPRRHPTRLSYLNGSAYGLSLGMLMLLIPLYAIEQGFRLSDQGIIIAAPAAFMIVARLPGGAICDRFGERPVLFFSFGAMIIAAVVAAWSASLWPLIVSQLFNGASRSVYWSAGQSYTSRSAEGEAGKVMGRLLSFESTAGIIGAVAIGVTVQAAGFTVGFATAAIAAGLGVLVTMLLPALPRKDQARSFKASFAPARTMLFDRKLVFAHYVAFMAAAYAGLVGGLFIAFFRDAGYGEGMTGAIRSLNGLGVAVIAFGFGSLLGTLGARMTGMIGITLTGLIAMAIAATGDLPVLPIFFMSLTGVTFGILRSLYPALAAQSSAPNQRAMALSVVSLYWAFAMLLSPLIFGFIADATSIRTAIFIFGGFSVAAGLLSPFVFALGRAPAPAEASAGAPRGAA